MNQTTKIRPYTGKRTPNRQLSCQEITDNFNFKLFPELGYISETFDEGLFWNFIGQLTSHKYPANEASRKNLKRQRSL